MNHNCNSGAPDKKKPNHICY